MPADDPRAKCYHRIQLVLAGIGLALTIGYLAAVLVTGAARLIDGLAARSWPATAWRVAVVAALLGAGDRLLTFPLAWVRGYWLPRRYGLLHQPLGSWLGDRAKAAAIGGLMALVAVEIVYALIGAVPAWWLLAAAAFVLLQLVVAFVFPVLLLPLFYRLTPLADAGLRERLVRLAARVGVEVVGVWVADQSRKSRTANAAVTGFGRTRRILVFDTLLKAFAPAEIEAVLAHELGHHVHHDLWRGLALQAPLGVVTLWVADRLLAAGVGWWGFSSPADPAGLPWLALVLTALGLVALPLANGFSRRIERQADDFALALTDDAGGFVGAMERLASLNLAERRPSRLKEFFLYSHPAIDRRIARAQTTFRARSSAMR